MVLFDELMAIFMRQKMKKVKLFRGALHHGGGQQTDELSKF
jgi:hypothetical protein